MDAIATRRMLWETYDPYSMWVVFGFIGIGSMLALIVYNHFVIAADKNPNHSFNIHGEQWVKIFLVPICLILLAATIMYPSLGLGLNTVFFWMMAIIAFSQKKRLTPATGS